MLQPPPIDDATMPTLDQHASFRPMIMLQDRIERMIVDRLQSGATRSEVRDAVYKLVDLLRLQQMSRAGVLSTLATVTGRARFAAPELEFTSWNSHADDRALVEHWGAMRYDRAD